MRIKPAYYDMILMCNKIAFIRITLLCSIFGNYVEWKQYTVHGDGHFALTSHVKVGNKN